MMRSMFAGVSGLRAHQIMMDVVGDNIANINTAGFKSSRVLFQDTLSQVLRGPSGGQDGNAGINPQEIGLGTRVAGIDRVITQGAIQVTGRATDVAIQGDGYFVVRSGGEQLFTRAGAFSFDRQGYLADPTGGVVQGWLADASGAINSSGPLGDVRLPLGQAIPPQVTTSVTVGGNLPADAAAGTVVTTAIDVVDSLGATRRITVEMTKQAAGNTWAMAVAGPDGTALGGSPVTLSFDGTTGSLTSPATVPSFTLPGAGGSAALSFGINLGTAGQAGALTQYGGTSTAAAIKQDGSQAGFLRSFAISDDGVITGVFSNGRTRSLGQLALATFNNPAGMTSVGESHFRAGAASGQANVGAPNTAGHGSLAAGAIEMSNVDLAQEFTQLIVAQRGFQANSRVVTASDELLQDLVNLKR